MRHVFLVLLLCGCGGSPVTTPEMAPPPASTPTITFDIALADAFTARNLPTDRELEAGTIEQALADPEFRDAPAAAFAVLHLRRTSLPATLTDLQAKSPQFQPVFTQALQRIRSARRELFVGAGPTLANLSQGELGDCFVLAVLGAMVHRDPAAVRDRFAPEPGGKLWVQFAAGRAVYIDALTDGELLVLATNDNAGLWVQTLEKAVGAYRVKYRTFEPQVAAYRTADQIPGQPLTPLTVLAHGGNTAGTLELLTGHAVEGFGLTWPRDGRTRELLQTRLHAAFVEASRARRLVLFGSPDSLRVPGMPARHAYAVLSYAADRQEVTLWNPHAKDFTPTTGGYATIAGRFTVPLRDFANLGGHFLFETDRIAR